MQSMSMKIMLILVLGGLAAGCSSMTPKYTFTINEPLVSNIKYDTGPKKPVVLKIIDERRNRQFHDSLASLTAAQVDLTNVEKPVAWFSRAIEKEFASRDIPLKVIDMDSAVTPDLVLTIKKYQITSRAVALFTPWETYHVFRGELAAGEKTYTIRSYFFNGKTYGGALKEIEEACFNVPMSIVVKDVASKINQYGLQYSASEERIGELKMNAEKKIKALHADAYRPVLELGNSNNPHALSALISFSSTEDRFTRAVALSGIGTLGAQEQLSFLRKKFKEYREIDRYMTLKAIGDIGTPEAIDIIRMAKEDAEYNREYGFKYVVDLYLER